MGPIGALLCNKRSAMIRSVIKSVFIAMRPRQWIKNLLIYAALIFDGQLFEPAPFLRTTLGFVLLCLISGTVYLLNDIADVEADRKHPKKQKRPIASGNLPIPAALASAIIIGILTIGISFFYLDWQFGVIILLYLGQNLLYSFWLKHVPIIDVLVIAAGFVLRVGAGVSLIEVQRFSPWLYVCTTLLALFFGFGKRRAEIMLLAADANSHRKVLDGYTIELLDLYLAIVSAVTIMAYSLYTFSAVNLPDNHAMMLTIPIVIYGIFRYLYLLQVKGEGGAPEEIVLKDRPLQATFVLWGISAIAVLYIG
jgi:4-hydroxybenzoate polyprenyltransferase